MAPMTAGIPPGPLTIIWTKDFPAITGRRPRIGSTPTVHGPRPTHLRLLLLKRLLKPNPAKRTRHRRYPARGLCRFARRWPERYVRLWPRLGRNVRLLR